MLVTTESEVLNDEERYNSTVQVYFLLLVHFLKFYKINFNIEGSFNSYARCNI